LKTGGNLKEILRFFQKSDVIYTGRRFVRSLLISYELTRYSESHGTQTNVNRANYALQWALCNS
jgi:hypothetical protein